MAQFVQATEDTEGLEVTLKQEEMAKEYRLCRYQVAGRDSVGAYRFGCR